jgi:predicted DNA-binding transcriptional regulator YafY
MNRVDRLMAMVVHLQSRRLVRAEELADHFEISLRTVYRDVAALGEAGIPIAGEAGVGYSLVKGYHLPPVMFTADEASALFLGSKIIDNQADASLRKQMGSALTKIRSILPRDRQDYLDRLDRSTAVVSRGSSADPRLSSESLVPIQRALAERRVLALEYRGKDREEITKRDVEPLGLVYYADNWHLIAHCRLRKEVREFRTDRILKIESKPEVFAPHESFSLKRYLESCKEKNFEMIQVRFQAEAMERVRREWYCGCVEETPDQNGFLATLAACSSSDWLVGWLLSFGMKAEVLAPKHLKDRVAGEAEQIAARYAPKPRSIPRAMTAHAGGLRAPDRSNGINSLAAKAAPLR